MNLSRQTTELDSWVQSVFDVLHRGLSYGHLAMRRVDGIRRIECLLIDRRKGSVQIIDAEVPPGTMEIPSMTSLVPAAHWAERLIGDQWGIRFAGHLEWKSLILNQAWPESYYPFHHAEDGSTVPRDSAFLRVQGDGVHEIPVGPIHAGVIEPGHFRFSCLGEVIANLEIRLGYLHRGVEANLAKLPIPKMRHLAENATSDMVVAGSLAHSVALEAMLGIALPQRVQALRTISLEIERIANHFGDLAALASDVGFAYMNAEFARLRGDVFMLGQKVGGTRFQTGFITPGGVSWDFDCSKLSAFREVLSILIRDAKEACSLFFSSNGMQDRFEGVGVLSKSSAEEFGMVGPAARASRLPYDSRKVFGQGLFPQMQIAIPTETGGDVWARAKVRGAELLASLQLVNDLIDNLPSGPARVEVNYELPANSVGIGIVESWRGELIHWLTTDGEGKVNRYVIRDPSFQNWTGLAIAIRNNLVADFPIVNKSFNLSYSGSDL